MLSYARVKMNVNMLPMEYRITEYKYGFTYLTAREGERFSHLQKQLRRVRTGPVPGSF